MWLMSLIADIILLHPNSHHHFLKKSERGRRGIPPPSPSSRAVRAPHSAPPTARVIEGRTPKKTPFLFFKIHSSPANSEKQGAFSSGLPPSPRGGSGGAFSCSSRKKFAQRLEYPHKKKLHQDLIRNARPRKRGVRAFARASARYFQTAGML